jgi:hypothetical protein
MTDYIAKKQHFFAYLNRIVSPELDRSPYLANLQTYLHRLISRSAHTAASILLDGVAAYPSLVRTKQPTNTPSQLLTDECVAWSDRVNQYLNDFEWVVAVTVRQRQFTRLAHPLQTEQIWTSDARDTESAREIAEYASTLRYMDAVHFLGELAGAWILSCPELLIRQDTGFIQHHSQWAQSDDDYIYILSSWLIEHGTAWMR